MINKNKRNEIENKIKNKTIYYFQRKSKRGKNELFLLVMFLNAEWLPEGRLEPMFVDR